MRYINGRLMFLASSIVSLIFLVLRLEFIYILNMWLVFSPFWIWHIITFFGYISGFFYLYKHRSSSKHLLTCYFASLNFVYQIILLVLQIVFCVKTEFINFSFTFVFIPIFLLCVCGFAKAFVVFYFSKNSHDNTSMDNHVNRYPFEIELFISVNFPTFILMLLRFNETITWSWTVVFIPTWIVMVIMGFLIFYFILLVLSLLNTSQIPDHNYRKFFYITTSGNSIAVICIFAFILLFVRKLDGISMNPLYVIFIPLFLSILALIFVNIYTEGTNNFRFGVDKPLKKTLRKLYNQSSEPVTGVQAPSVDINTQCR